MDVGSADYIPFHGSLKRSRSNDLPYDIICELLHIAAVLDPAYGPRRVQDVHSYKYEILPGHLGWIRMTHVCRFWREVGYEQHTLWAGIVCAFAPEIEDIMSRAGNAPLPVFIRHDNPESMHGWSYADISHIMPRAHSFESDVNSNYGLRESTGPWPVLLAGQSLPSVRVIVVPDAGLGYINTQQGLRPNISAFVNATALRAPHLHALTINLPWPVHAPSLRTLCVRKHRAQWPGQVLAHFITSFPSLEELEVLAFSGDNSSTDPHGWVIDARERDEGIVLAVMSKYIAAPSFVHLPRLKRITLDQGGCDVAEFLNHLNHPASVVLKVINAPYHSGVFESFEPHGSLNNLTITSATTDIWTPADFTLRTIWAIDQPCLAGEHTSENESSVSMCGVKFKDFPALLAATVVMTASKILGLAFSHDCKCADYPGVRCSGAAEFIEEEELAEFLQGCINVATLRLHRQGPISSAIIISLLARSDPLLLPALHTLDIDVNEVVDQAWWSGLRNMLGIRKAAGHSLVRLIIRGVGACHFSDCPGHQGLTRNEDTECLDLEDEVVTCLSHREISLEQERLLVEEVVDARDDWVYICECEDHCYASCDSDSE